MANVSVRNLDDGVHDALRRRAERTGTSMEAVIRQILTEATRHEPPADTFLRLVARAQALGGAELEEPPAQYESRMDAVHAAWLE